MEGLNFYELLTALKMRKSTGNESLEESIQLIRELTAQKAQNRQKANFNKKQNNPLPQQKRA